MYFDSVKGKSASENWVWICHGDLQRKSPTHPAHLNWEALNAEKAQILKLNKKKECTEKLEFTFYFDVN